jgi:NAD(P)-dependent dehydrogenase (short-subunit alcohol dehydrogenase family)
MVLLTYSDIVTPIRVTAFNPVLTAPLLFILKGLQLNPSFLLSVLPLPVHKFFLDLASGTCATKVLKVLLILSGLNYVNKYLSQRSLNNNFSRQQRDRRDEIVVITGGSGGIGSLIIEGLAKQGYKKIVNLDINPPAERTSPGFDNVVFYKINLMDPASISEVSTKIKEEIGHPSILLHVAGTGIGKTILNSTPESIRLTFGVNTIAPFLLTKEFLPNMIKENYGHILVLASLASFFTPAQMADYCGSKAAVLSFAEGLRQEVKHRYQAPGIRVSTIHPNWVKTPLTSVFGDMDHFYGRQLLPEQVSEKVVEQVMCGNGGQIFVPEDLAGTSLLRGLPSWLGELTRDNSKDMIVVNKEF